MTEPMMQAVVLRQPGGPEALELTTVPRLSLEPGTAIIRTAAFGLNRSDLFTRQGIRRTSSCPAFWGLRRWANLLSLMTRPFVRVIG